MTSQVFTTLTGLHWPALAPCFRRASCACSLTSARNFRRLQWNIRPHNLNSRPGDGARPLWERGIALATIWLLVLQPAVSSAQLSQTPMFTVTSAPPNVMLMFDDSTSMNRLDLNPPAAYANPTFSLVGTAATIPTLKLNTVGYFQISGMRWYKARQYSRTTTTGNSALRTQPCGRPRSIHSPITRQFSTYLGITTGFVFPILPSAVPPTSLLPR